MSDPWPFLRQAFRRFAFVQSDQNADVNPFTKEPMEFAAKPAKAVKASSLKVVKDAV
jgi:hypothetical protein